MAHAGARDAPAPIGSLRRAAVAALFLLASAAGALGQEPSIVVSRNIFFDRAERPERTLAGSAGLSLGPERVAVGNPTRLRLISPTATVSAALHFRAAPEADGGWVLTVFITSGKHERDFYYLSQGRQAVQGKLQEQAGYYANGLETELAAADAGGRPRRVREIVLQDDGQLELRVALDGDTLQIAAVPPKFGGTPNPGRFPGGKGAALRFLDYRLLAGGYTDNAFGELWLFDFLVARGNYFTDDNETRGVLRLAVAQQAWRWERFSVWMEGGAAVTQRRNEKTNQTADARASLTAGLTGHWRYDSFGAALHLGGAGGPLLAQLLGGWQFSERWGALAYWQQVKDSSGYGLGASTNW